MGLRTEEEQRLRWARSTHSSAVQHPTCLALVHLHERNLPSVYATYFVDVALIWPCCCKLSLVPPRQRTSAAFSASLAQCGLFFVPDIGMDVLLDVSVTRMATFTRVYDSVTFPLLIRVPPPRALHLWHNVVCFPRLMSPCCTLMAPRCMCCWMSLSLGWRQPHACMTRRCHFSPR